MTVTGLVKRSSSSEPTMTAAKATRRPWGRLMRPVASGRPAVRIMRASDLRSRTSLSAAAPAEMSAMPARVSSRPMWKLGMAERTEPR